MPKRTTVLTGIAAFGAGVAVGSLWPKGGGFIENLFKKLGFEWSEVLLLWDPEASEPVAKPKKRKKSLVKKKRIFSPRQSHRPIRLASSRSSSRLAKAAASRN